MSIVIEFCIAIGYVCNYTEPFCRFGYF